MYLFYIDDSGDTGLKNEGSPTDAFVLAALIVEDYAWLATLDEIKGFRRFLRDKFGLRIRDELKASYLIHNKGPFERLNLGDDIRLKIYKMALRLQRKIGTIKIWAIVGDKNKAFQLNKKIKPDDINDNVWQRMIERIERFTFYGKDTCIILPDEGGNTGIMAKFRQMRRISYVPSAYEKGTFLPRPATFIVEDPNFRRSHQSYFVQLADLNAYAAYRHIYPTPYFGAEYWEQLGDARWKDVNKYSGGPTGILLWPQK